MKLIADENFPRPSVIVLRDAGFDLEFIQETSPGAEDIDVLQMAGRTRRILLTFDRDFGEHIFHHKQIAPPGVVLLRFKPFHPREPGDILETILQEKVIVGKYTVITRKNIRQRDLPLYAL